jgi:hypothetical protein
LTPGFKNAAKPDCIFGFVVPAIVILPAFVIAFVVGEVLWIRANVRARAIDANPTRMRRCDEWIVVKMTLQLSQIFENFILLKRRKRDPFDRSIDRSGAI